MAYVDVNIIHFCAVLSDFRTFSYDFLYENFYPRSDLYNVTQYTFLSEHPALSAKHVSKTFFYFSFLKNVFVYATRSSDKTGRPDNNTYYVKVAVLSLRFFRLVRFLLSCYLVGKISPPCLLCDALQ